VSKRIRVGFIGAGGHATRVHYPTLAQMKEEVDLVALADPDEARRVKVADEFGVRERYVDHRELLAKAQVEAVYVSLPPKLLKPVILDCMKAKLHTFCEKPFGASYDEAAVMAEAARKAGVKTLCAYNRRYSTVLIEAKKRVEERGPVSQIVAEFHKNMRREGAYFGMSIMITDIGHVVDCARWLAGEAVEVVPWVDNFEADWPNIYTALVRFDSGAAGIILANRASGSRYERFEVHGVGISAYVRAPERLEIWTDDRKQPTVIEYPEAEVAISPAWIEHYGYAPESRHFFQCIRDDVQPSSNFADSAKTMLLCEQLARLRPA
jgi:predicted dehydrogenase